MIFFISVAGYSYRIVSFRDSATCWVKGNNWAGRNPSPLFPSLPLPPHHFSDTVTNSQLPSRCQVQQNVCNYERVVTSRALACSASLIGRPGRGLYDGVRGNTSAAQWRTVIGRAMNDVTSTSSSTSLWRRRRYINFVVSSSSEPCRLYSRYTSGESWDGVVQSRRSLESNDLVPGFEVWGALEHSNKHPQASVTEYN